MAEATEKAESTPTVSFRIESYRKEVQALVLQGGEQPQFEFKRAASLRRENLDDRLDFVKLVQGIANAHLTTERCIVIGADHKQKQFYPVPNIQDFDMAKVSQVLSTYLHPVPSFEVFGVKTDDDIPFVLLVLHPKQPRPISVVKQGHSQAGKVRLEAGDIWIKKNTELVRANRADLDQMYEARMEEEAENRARKRVKHLLEIAPSSQMSQPPTGRMPTVALLAGPRAELQAFVEQLIASDELRKFRMLLEFARGQLIDSWDNLNVRGPRAPANFDEFAAAMSGFYRDEFVPFLQSVVELGLIAIKFECDRSWLVGVIDLLVETFEATRGLNWLKSHLISDRPDFLPWWRPAFEVYVGLRAIAVYTIARSRPQFLADVLSPLVVPLSIDDHPLRRTPLIFWPFVNVSVPDFSNGRALFCWNERIEAAWGKYFGQLPKFLASSAQLEFLLEFNSYFGTNMIRDPKLADWLNANLADVYFEYKPDLYSHDLEPTLPMAERLYEILAQPDLKSFPSSLAVNGRLVNYVFTNLRPQERLQVYGGFLYHLKTWQETFVFQALRRWPFLYVWPGRLGKLMDEHKQRLESAARV